MRDFLFLTDTKGSSNESKSFEFQSLDEGFFISNQDQVGAVIAAAVIGFSPLMRDFLFLTNAKDQESRTGVPFQSLDEGFFISNT